MPPSAARCDLPIALFESTNRTPVKKKVPDTFFSPTFTASERFREAGLGETQRRRQKTPLSERRLPFRIPKVRPRETGHAAHEPLISRKVIEEAPLTGLSFTT